MRKIIFTPFKVFWQAVVTWWDSWTDLFVLNLIVTLCCVTVILGPPAIFGLYAVIHEMVTEGSSPGIRGWWQYAKKYALKSWLWFGANLLVLLLATNAYFFYTQINQGWAEVLRWLLLFLAVAWLFFVQFYSVPFFMEQENKSLLIAWRNAALTFLASPGYTFVLVVIINAIAVIGIVTVIILFITLPGLPIVLGNVALRDRLEAFEKIRQKG